MTTVNVTSALTSVVSRGRVSVAALPAFVQGGMIQNPPTASLMGLTATEPLYVDPTGPAGLAANGSTIALQPGDKFIVIPDSTSPVWVNAASSGHQFFAYGETLNSKPVAQPVPGTFPPPGPVTMTGVIGAYPYKEYDDDDDVQAFFASYNQMAQSFIDTINGMNLPIYTQPQISGALLDWVAQGLYGMIRPALASGQSKFLGPLNTYAFNAAPPLNSIRLIGPNNIVVTTDDTFKRILTWAFLKGDGKVFNIRWLKRRIMRFLTGVNGTNPNIDQTYQISVTFGTNGEVAIKFIDSIATVTRGAIFNGFMFNTTKFNELDIMVEPLTPLPYRQIFEEAVQTGALELPFQFTYNIIL